MMFRTSVSPAKSEVSIKSSPVWNGETKRLSIHRICLFGFDEIHGNSLVASSKISKKHSIVSHTEAELAEICLPDGGHIRENDAGSVILLTKNDVSLYGYFCFRNMRSTSEKRGARQASILLISDFAGMDFFRPFLVDALETLMSGSAWGNCEYVTKSLNELRTSLDRSLNKSSASSTALKVFASDDICSEDVISVDLWQRSYKIRRPLLSPGEFGGAFLKDLLKLFREKTMRIWYALASEKRIVFTGSHSSASSLSSVVLASPMLVGDLAPFVVPLLEPYVTLAVVDRILNKRTFVCGTNNALFSQKTDWWDMCCDLNTGTIYEEQHSFVLDDASMVNENGIAPLSKLKSFRRRVPSFSQRVPIIVPPKVSGGVEMAFVSRVLHDMEFQSESWLRRQFHDFTLSFLNRVGRRGPPTDLTAALAGLLPAASMMQSKLGKFAEQFPQTSLWKKYRAKQDEVWGGNRSCGLSSVTPFGVSVPSPTNAGDFEDVGFLSSKGKTLAPFTLEGPTGAFRTPSGFVKVEEISKRRSANRGYTDKSPKICPGHHRQDSGRWVKVAQENEEPYFWNVTTGETAWDVPDDDLL